MATLPSQGSLGASTGLSGCFVAGWITRVTFWLDAIR